MIAVHNIIFETTIYFITHRIYCRYGSRLVIDCEISAGDVVTVSY